MIDSWTPEKIHELEQKLVAGETLQACADFFQVSKQRVGQIKKRHLAHLQGGSFGLSLRTQQRATGKRELLLKKYNRKTWITTSALEAAQASSFRRKKGNVSKTDWEFTVQMSDIEWPTHCPILGLELDWFAESAQENSPSYDRIDHTKGYTPGNVAIMSWRANRIKNDGTAEEHRKIADWLDKRGGV